jgi:hypothetical protein
MGRHVQVATMALIALACGAAQASEWVSATKGENGKSEGFVDVSSIRVTGTIRQAWIKVVLEPRTQKGPAPYENKFVSRAVSREAFDCSEQKHRTEAITFYFADGTNFVVPESSFNETWTPVTPDTLSDEWMLFVCAWKPK